MAEPPPTGLPVPARALAIVAHPDDAELKAGATLARWAAAGCSVSVLVCTDGSKGTWDAAQDPDDLVRRRRDEQRAALRVLGGTGECVFLDRVDGELVAGPAERDAIASVVRRLRPDVVLGHDPWKRYRIHPDHREAGRLACESIVAARDPLFLRGDPALPWRPSSLLLFEADEVDHLEPADERWLDVKLAALMEHRSQFRSTHHIDDPDDAAQVEAFRRRVAADTLPAERFHLVADL